MGKWKPTGNNKKDIRNLKRRRGTIKFLSKIGGKESKREARIQTAKINRKIASLGKVK